MNVVYVHADKPHEWNSAEWRCAIPARALNRTRKHHAKLLPIEYFAENGPAAQYACEDADVIVLQRGAMPDTWAALEHWRQRGKVVLADIDDGYPQITAEHPAFEFWHRGIVRGHDGAVVNQLPRPAIQEMAAGLARVRGLTAPNRLILADWAEVVGVPGQYVPNYLPTRPYLAAKRTRGPDMDGTVWVAWGGSAGHFGSFRDSGVLYALARVIAKRPHVRFVMMGADLRILASLPLKDSQKINLHWRPYAEWPGRLVNFDVGLIPVAGAFDARRSWLKPLEYSLAGVPWIASRSAAYEDLAGLGTHVDNTPDAWAAALEQLLDVGPNPGRLRAARVYAEAQDIDANVPKIIKAYERFIK